MTNRKPWWAIVSSAARCSFLCLALAACSSAEDEARRETATACRDYASEAEACLRKTIGAHAEGSPQLGAAKDLVTRTEKASIAELAALRHRCNEGASSLRKVCR
jgi:hypothetical protein